MDAFVDLSWRIYPAFAMIAAGAAVLVWGVRKVLYGLSLPISAHPTKMQTFVIGFRIAVIGITLVGLGISWHWHITWVFVLSLVFGGEEVLETTTLLAILRRRTGTGLIAH